MSGPVSAGRRALAIASIETFVGTMTSRALVFVLAIVTARLLGSQAYGEFSIVQATALLCALALGQPLGVVINRYSAALWERDPQRSVRLTSSLISLTVLVSAALALALYFASPALAAELLNRPRLAPFIAAAGPAIMLHVFFLVATSTLRGFHEFRAAAGTQAVHAVIGAPVALFMVWKWGLWGAVLSLIAFWGVGSLISTSALGRLARRRELRFSLTLRTEDVRAVAPFYFPYLITTLAVVLSNWLVRAILAHGEDAYRQVGLFSAAYQYAQVSQLIVAPLLLVATPMLTTAWSRSDHQAMRTLAADLFTASYLLLSSLAVLAIGWAPWLLTLLGRDYAAALRPTELLFPALAINAILALIGPVLVAAGRVWLLVQLTLVRVALLIGLVALLRGGGASGAALAYLLTETAMVVVLLISFAAFREYEIIRLVRRMTWFSIPGFVLCYLGLAVAAVPREIAGVIAATTVMLGALLALDKDDRASLLAFVRRLGSSLARSGAGSGGGTSETD